MTDDAKTDIQPIDWLETERWMKQLGTQFDPLLMLTPTGWVNEPQVKDPEVWDELVKQAMARRGARYALYSHAERWAVRGPRGEGLARGADDGGSERTCVFHATSSRRGQSAGSLLEARSTALIPLRALP